MKALLEDLLFLARHDQKQRLLKMENISLSSLYPQLVRSLHE